MTSNPLEITGSSLVTLTRGARTAESKRGKIWLVKPPYFTPWTPPLGISILKAFLEQNGFGVTCYDYNIDPDLWGMHHKYFSIIQSQEDVSTNDGYSKLWAILNAHMLAHMNRGDAAACHDVVAKILPLYGIKYKRESVAALIPLIEHYFDRLGELTDLIDLSDYSVVGTSTYTTSLSSSLFILRRIKQRYPEMTTVMGGGVFADDLALGSDNLDTLIANYPYIDHVVLGEGELLFLKLLEGELAHKRVVSIADLNGETLTMDNVPSPDFTDFDPEKYYHLTIEGARSCPFQCSFCSETVQWGDYRKKTADLFSSQIVGLSEKFGLNSFFMGDSLMNPYIGDLSKRLLDQKANVLYDGYLRADKPVMNRNRVKEWARSGCFRVRLGIESAATRVLQSMDKMTTPETISEVLKSLASAGIRTTTYWIVGFPDESDADFQETLDFIRDHHRFIYELEAHPYYYYPYGQIGSRLHQSYSLYPDEVTDIVKFKTWEIPDVNPKREVRFERLRRISKLAQDLGIPNIYTMEDRYKAEDRWRLLHSLAVDVYEGSDIFRKAISVSANHAESPNIEASSEGRVLCYEAHVNKKISVETLQQAARELVRYNDVLQTKFAQGTEETGDYVYLHKGEIDPAEWGSAKTEILQALTRQTKDPSEPKFKIAVFDSGPGANLLLMAHEAIADAHSIKLLFEDLFRIYEQLAGDRDIALRAVKKTYFEFAENRSDALAGIASASAQANVTSTDHSDQPPATHSSIALDAALTKRILSNELAEYGLAPTELLLIAALRSVAKLDPEARFSATQDIRSLDGDLVRTAGPLTRVVELPRDSVSDNPASVIQKIRHALHERARSGILSNAAGGLNVLLNLSYFGDEPWLGGDSWTPAEFVIADDGPQASFDLEIIPLLSAGTLTIRIEARETEKTAKIVQGLANHPLNSLKGSARMILNYYRSGSSLATKTGA